MRAARGHTIAVVAGDGIGPDVTAAAIEVAGAVAARARIELHLRPVSLGADHYLATGEILPEPTVAELAACDAILLGALGDPRVAPGVLEVGVIVGLRRRFRQAVNLRPVRLLPGVASPLRTATTDTVDFVVVRENTEGLYAGGASSAQSGTPHAVAIQSSITTRAATEEVVRFAYELAARRRGHLTLCHKTNILVAAGRIWQETASELATEFPEVELDYVHADAMTLHMIERPERFDVIVTDNLFGDILSDLGAAIAGGLGTAASANLNVDGAWPSMFEPVHGSAPDIAGTGAANPAAAILSVAMMFDHLGHGDLAEACTLGVRDALVEVRRRGDGMQTTAFSELAAARAGEHYSEHSGTTCRSCEGGSRA